MAATQKPLKLDGPLRRRIYDSIAETIGNTPLVRLNRVAQEAGGNPAVSAMGVDQSTGSMEGKEVRFGAGLSALWGVTTTVTSNGSVNSMHDSWTPLGGLMPMIGMWLNNIFGGVGVGFINMLIFVIVAVFVPQVIIERIVSAAARYSDEAGRGVYGAIG